MADPREETERTGSGGSSDGDTQPDDAGASGTFGDLESDESKDDEEKAADA